MSLSTSIHPEEAATIPIGGDEATAQMSGFGPSDIVIAVMGVTGSGKSTFISQLVGENIMTGGHGLHSDTKVTRAYEFHRPGQSSIHLVDTPGFDDTSASDAEVLCDIAAFMTMIYKSSARLAGIIYLHRITDNRFAGSTVRSLRTFKELCGQDAYKHVMLVTSMWDQLHDGAADEATERERQLVNEDDMWKDMHVRGSLVKRWHAGKDSAVKIINDLLAAHSSHGDMHLQIQRELVLDGKELAATSAGKLVNLELAESREHLDNELEESIEGIGTALARGDTRMYEESKIQKEDSEENRRRVDADQKALQVNSDTLLRGNAEKYQQERERVEKQHGASKRSMNRCSDELASIKEEIGQLQKKLDSGLPESEREKVMQDLQELKAEAERMEKELAKKKKWHDTLTGMLTALARVAMLTLAVVGAIVKFDVSEAE